MMEASMKTGLVLEGGAMRGMFTAGVLDVFLKNEIHFDAVIGVSAGAAFGCNLKSHQIGRTIRYNKKYAKDPRYCSFRSLIRTGDLYGAEFCYHDLPEKLDVFDMKTFDSDPMEFYIGVTEVESGSPCYYRYVPGDSELYEWMRASASMPLVSRNVTIGGKSYLDGGISDSIPVRAFEGMGYERNIIILTQPSSYIKKKNSLLPLMRLALRKYPGIVSAMERRHEVYNETREYIFSLEREGRALVIRPDSDLGIGHIEHDPAKLQGVYDIGVAMGDKRIEEVRRFITESTDI